MKSTLALILFILLTYNHSIAGVINSIREPIDTSKYSIMKLEKYDFKYFDDKDTSYVATALSGDEIIKIERIIKSKVAQNNKEQKRLSDSLKKISPNVTFFTSFVDNPQTYYKQILPVLNSKGEIEVWVNCFCDKEEKAYWKKFMIGVSGGGSCYFSLRINLTKSEVTYFGVNSPL